MRCCCNDNISFVDSHFEYQSFLILCAESFQIFLSNIIYLFPYRYTKSPLRFASRAGKGLLKVVLQLAAILMTDHSPCQDL